MGFLAGIRSIPFFCATTSTRHVLVTCLAAYHYKPSTNLLSFPKGRAGVGREGRSRSIAGGLAMEIVLRRLYLDDGMCDGVGYGHVDVAVEGGEVMCLGNGGCLY